MFVAAGEIYAAILQIREEVGVDLGVIKEVVLVEFGVTQKCRALRSGDVVEGLAHSGWHRKASHWVRGVSWGAANDRAANTDERVEVTGLDLRKERGELRVARIDLQVIVTLINKACVISKPADKGIVFDVEVAPEPDHVTVVIVIVE